MTIVDIDRIKMHRIKILTASAYRDPAPVGFIDGAFLENCDTPENTPAVKSLLIL